MGSGAGESPFAIELNALLEQYQEALGHKPNDPKLLIDIAGILQKLDRVDEALVHHRRGAQAYLELGFYLDAARACGRILRLNPQDEVAHQIVDRLQLEQLVDPVALERILASGIDGRHRHVSDSRPVVVIGTERGDPSAGRWVATLERPLDMDPTEETPLPEGMILTERPLTPLPSDFLAMGTRREYDQDETIIVESERSTELLLIVRGAAELTKVTRSSEPATIAMLGEGAILGDLALLGDGRSHVTARALEPCEVLVYNAADVREQMRTSPDVNRLLLTSYRDRLQRIALAVSPLFSPLSAVDADALLRLFNPVRLEEREVLIQAGASPAGLFLVLLGALEVHRLSPEGRRVVLVERLSDGDFIGHASPLFDEQPSPYTVTAASFCQLVCLPSEALLDVVERYPELGTLLRDEAERRELLHGEALASVEESDDSVRDTLEDR
jgi:CRP-like cAMP-binding protein